MTATIDAGGHRLAVDVRGEGAPPWLCLHGLVDDMAIWDRLLPGLVERGRAIRVDQRGHGCSEAPPGPCSRMQLAGDVVAVLDALGVEKARLVGHSMGGIVAMETALAFPDRVDSLVLVGTASQCSEKVAGWYERIALAGENDGRAGLGRLIYGEDSPKSIRGDARGIAQVTRMLKSLHDDPLTPKLPEIACPALLVVGDRDPMGTKASALLARGLPDARLVEVEDCGHWVHVAKPEALLAAIDDWLPATEN